jgi:hypothetical protein
VFSSIFVVVHNPSLDKVEAMPSITDTKTDLIELAERLAEAMKRLPCRSHPFVRRKESPLQAGEGKSQLSYIVE